jgi:dTMP kinase
MLVAFEGIDGSGKSMQAKLLYARLKAKRRKVILTYEPSNGPIGGMLETAIKKDREMDNQTLQLFFTADRAYHLLYTIRPALDNGIDVITDRYMFSTIAYGAASGLDRKWLIELNKLFPVPDFTFVLDVKPETAMKRITERALKFAESEARYGLRGKAGASRDIFETVKFLGRVRDEYIRMKKGYSRYYVIDSEEDPESTEARIDKIINV